MDKFQLKTGIDKNFNLSDSTTSPDDSFSACYSDSSETSDFALMNQSIIIAGSVNIENINNDILDISNSCANDELNTNIDVLMLDNKHIFSEDTNDAVSLRDNIEPSKSHCMRGRTLSQPSTKSDSYKSKNMCTTTEIPQVEITSHEESNRKFQVKFHIKEAFKK